MDPMGYITLSLHIAYHIYIILHLLYWYPSSPKSSAQPRTASLSHPPHLAKGIDPLKFLPANQGDKNGSSTHQPTPWGKVSSGETFQCTFKTSVRSHLPPTTIIIIIIISIIIIIIIIWRSPNESHIATSPIISPWDPDLRIPVEVHSHDLQHSPGGGFS